MMSQLHCTTRNAFHIETLESRNDEQNPIHLWFVPLHNIKARDPRFESL